MPLRRALWAILAGLLLAALLTALVALRYPRHPGAASLPDLIPSLIPLVPVFLIVRALSHFDAPGLPEGLRAGLLTGLLWIAEISFNNFAPHSLSTANARFYVDNGAWALIALLILLASVRAAWQSRHYLAALRCGLWSGLVSGLLACLMALLLIHLWMPALLSDPLNIAEYAERSAHPGAPSMSTYFAWETLTGALGHLIVLGLVMGLMLGLLAGLPALARRRRTS